MSAVETIETRIPSRMDRLPWSGFHRLVILALGITWILDGLEVTLVGAVSGILGSPRTLGLSPSQIGLLASFYLLGAVLGSLVFGWATDRFGRSRLFFVTLLTYLAGVTLTAVAWNLLEFLFVPLPHRRRDRRRILGHKLGHRRTDPGAPARAGGPDRQRQLLAGCRGGLSLDHRHSELAPFAGEPRLAARIRGRRGNRIGSVVSPSLRAGKPPLAADARPGRPRRKRVAAEIEARVSRTAGRDLPAPDGASLRIRALPSYGFGMVANAMFKRYRTRASSGWH